MAHSFDILRMATIHSQLPPIAIGLRQRRNAKNRPSSSVCANGAMRKKPPKSGCRNHIPRLANNLYNRSSRLPLPSATISIGKTRPSSSVCANGAMRKTAEERFNMLARGWLAYPVTPMHAHLPPKSGCRNVILAKPPYEAHLLNWACPNSTNLPHLPD